MKDQNTLGGNETPAERYQRALDLFTESVLKPDAELRGCAYNQDCFNELMEIREHVLQYLKTLKETQNVSNPDESDILEQEKLIETKRVYSDFRNQVYTEKEYWEGKVPDDQFESYLNKYGYEYTPVSEIKLSQRARHSDLDAL